MKTDLSLLDVLVASMVADGGGELVWVEVVSRDGDVDWFCGGGY